MQYKRPPNDIHFSIHNWAGFRAHYDATQRGYNCEMHVDLKPRQWFVKGSQWSIATLLAIPCEGRKVTGIGAFTLDFYDDWIDALLKEVGLEFRETTPVN